MSYITRALTAEMYAIVAAFSFFCAVESASYQRYGDGYTNTQYPPYSYSTISSIYQTPYTPYKTRYNSDISSFPEATRYPNYNTGLSTTGYNSFSTMKSNIFYQPGGYNTERYNQAYSPYEMPFMSNSRDYCVNRSPQNGIWVESLMGMWYGVEYVQHLAGDARVDYTRTCIVIHISEPVDQPSTQSQLFHVQHINAKFRQEYRHLRLLWDESGAKVEYSLFFRNDSAGYWQVLGGQNGSMTLRSNYHQFSGTVQVLKAVNDHLLLNFCQDPTNGAPAQLYSVLFSRDPARMPRWEIESIHSLLQNKKLSVASRRMVCGNNAAKNIASILSTFVVALFAYLARSQ